MTPLRHNVRHRRSAGHGWLPIVACCALLPSALAAQTERHSAHDDRGFSAVSGRMPRNPVGEADAAAWNPFPDSASLDPAEAEEKRQAVWMLRDAWAWATRHRFEDARRLAGRAAQAPVRWHPGEPSPASVLAAIEQLQRASAPSSTEPADARFSPAQHGSPSPSSTTHPSPREDLAEHAYPGNVHPGNVRPSDGDPGRSSPDPLGRGNAIPAPTGSEESVQSAVPAHFEAAVATASAPVADPILRPSLASRRDVRSAVPFLIVPRTDDTPSQDLPDLRRAGSSASAAGVQPAQVHLHGPLVEGGSREPDMSGYVADRERSHFLAMVAAYVLLFASLFYGLPLLVSRVARHLPALVRVEVVTPAASPPRSEELPPRTRPKRRRPPEAEFAGSANGIAGHRPSASLTRQPRRAEPGSVGRAEFEQSPALGTASEHSEDRLIEQIVQDNLELHRRLAQPAA